ncbi:phosphomethylpyrimidine kinase [Striga asiatica]|uniref:Phosphomethylpyrimidine kinase n=1 Tax=Striga asiatica TaxID=4170 RepID=A0A5A7Q9Y8_STRAF|nr:phosphomethylpyrimidine kinase [Striga asiatica]
MVVPLTALSPGYILLPLGGTSSTVVFKESRLLVGSEVVHSSSRRIRAARFGCKLCGRGAKDELVKGEYDFDRGRRKKSMLLKKGKKADPALYNSTPQLTLMGWVPFEAGIPHLVFSHITLFPCRFIISLFFLSQSLYYDKVPVPFGSCYWL